MALLASDVKLPQDLNSVFGGIGTKAYNQIGQNYGDAMTRATGDASAQGFAGGPTDYTKERLGTAQGLDVENLEAGLGSELGNTGYKEAIASRNFNQQKQIADLLGDAMAPSELQQIFAGIGGGAQAGASLLPFAGMIGGGGAGSPSTPSPLSLYGGGTSGYASSPMDEYNYYTRGGY